MDTKSDASFYPVDVRLPRAVIEPATDGELAYDFFKDFTVKVPILPSVELGEGLWVYIRLEGAGSLFLPKTVDQQMLDNGMLISHQKWYFPERITEVSLRYEFRRLNGDIFDARRRIYAVLQP
ncbi:hypothetical protein [Pseudomonas sp. Q11]|uniref:hypothetical protein n=1 Tax=Pseudomonas sp. Q11 TaxID=2968470 RepID=UPI00210D2710|nr:hypothetical protein [Pseudomonas sp. Q11]MCQ6255025.1 hypothetical protein [Pseudomonas sp. Q11]